MKLNAYQMIRLRFKQSQTMKSAMKMQPIVVRLASLVSLVLKQTMKRQKTYKDASFPMCCKLTIGSFHWCSEQTQASIDKVYAMNRKRPTCLIQSIQTTITARSALLKRYANGCTIATFLAWLSFSPAWSVLKRIATLIELSRAICFLALSLKSNIYVDEPPSNIFRSADWGDFDLSSIIMMASPRIFCAVFYCDFLCFSLDLSIEKDDFPIDRDDLPSG